MREKEYKKGGQTSPAQKTQQEASPPADGFVSLAQAMDDGEQSLLTPREEKLQRLKEQVQNGSYKPNLRKVAMVLVHDDADSLIES